MGSVVPVFWWSLPYISKGGFLDSMLHKVGDSGSTKISNSVKSMMGHAVSTQEWQEKNIDFHSEDSWKITLFCPRWIHTSFVSLSRVSCEILFEQNVLKGSDMKFCPDEMSPKQIPWFVMKSECGRSGLKQVTKSLQGILTSQNISQLCKVYLYRLHP